jgi:AraC family transcriptional regulator
MAVVRLLLETPRLSLGEFHCPPGDRAWEETNYIGDAAHVVFPSRPVLISQTGKEPVLATPNHAILYDPGRSYRRELRSTEGDRCIFISLPPSTLARIDTLALDDRQQLVSTHSPTAASTYLAQHLLVRRLGDRTVDRCEAEDAAWELVQSTLATAANDIPGRRERTAAAHRALAEAAKAELWSSLSERLSLPELARRLNTSPSHLARVFRRETGFSVDDYGRNLRLRAALERISDHRRRLTSLALDLGFSSHGHFTDAFRREFGVAPSALRPEAARPRT